MEYKASAAAIKQLDSIEALIFSWLSILKLGNDRDAIRERIRKEEEVARRQK